MRVLGVNGTPGQLWLAVIDDGTRQVLPNPTHIGLLDDASPGDQLRTALDEAVRLLETLSIDRVRVLDAEAHNSHPPTYSQMVARVGLESSIILAANRLGIDVARVNRAHLRGVLGFETKGPLTNFVSTVLQPSAPHWKNERDLAGLAALVGLEE